MSLRASIAAKITDFAVEAANFRHDRNYRRLTVYRPGFARWHEHFNPDDDIIDSLAAGTFQRLPSLARVGTGRSACRCTFCNNVGPANQADDGSYYESQADAVSDAVAATDTTVIEQEMAAALAAIPAGFFEDEGENV